jgi:hypothetical protein
LPHISPWAADHLSMLIKLENVGLAAAKGDSLVHFDAFPHNILIAGERVLFVDWPHARLGAPFLDLITFASSAEVAGIDSEELLAGRAGTANQHPTSSMRSLPLTPGPASAAACGGHSQGSRRSSRPRPRSVRPATA